MRGPGDVLYNFHWIVRGEAARAAQAYAGFLRPFLKRHGIRSLINLRGPNPNYGWWHYERRAAEAAGAVHIDVMLDSRHLPRREMLVTLFDAFDAAPKPFLVKCSGGQDRTSLAAALYLLHRDGWRAIDRAQQQFARLPYLHFPKAHQRWLAQFARFAAGQAKGRPIADWVRDSYTPEAFRDWLEANGHAGSFKAIFEKRSPAHKWQW
jgi:protein tyrosine/serine phosphatase